MKSLVKIGLLITMSVLAMPSSFAGSQIHSALPATNAQTKEMEMRLETIRAMDLKKMSRPERKEVKQEVKAIKKKMDSSGGIYISVGAVILIVILLILLL